MGVSGDVRASDGEREETARVLREHFAAGRLGSEELDQRVTAAYAATTVGELRGLVADLPPLPVAAREARMALRQRRAGLQRRLLQETGAGLAPFLVCTVIWLAAGASGTFWPAFVLIAVIVPLLRGGWQLYGPAPDLDRFEAELEARSRRHSGPGSRREARAVRREQRRGGRPGL